VRTAAPPPPGPGSRQRQRQRLIDACISALHLHGPSHTTVERVVALADLSPGIVRFYFDSKDAMLVASLEYLAAEFEEKLLAPVARLKDTPVRALERLVDLYFDPEIASTRKVSVWYAFWGEASSRQEYLEICGGKDEDFAALVRELIERLIVESDKPHLDADAIALGLIGVLEVLWQGFAFQSEESIDRPGARRRSMAYLRSVFPAQFDYPSARLSQRPAAAATRGRRLPPWAYADRALFAAERSELFCPSWEMVGHESDLPAQGHYLTRELACDRVLAIRDAEQTLRAYHNSCPVSPHALLSAPKGIVKEALECSLHDLRFDLQGRPQGSLPGASLSALELLQRSGLIFVRSRTTPPRDVEGPAPHWSGWRHLTELKPSGTFERDVPADWKLIVEQWLEFSLSVRPRDALAALAVRAHVQLNALTGTTEWQATLPADASGWTAARYAHLAARFETALLQRLYLPPHQLLESRPDGLTVLQVLPQAQGRCRVRRFEFRRASADPAARALAYLGTRLSAASEARQIDVAASTQAGLTTSGYSGEDHSPVSPGLARFRDAIWSLLSATSRNEP
jgi:phenylpropionate dioxygenase-like ring-hydroxylating dioxygenase large terminal subunit/AcrR family transcriptional regulator